MQIDQISYGSVKRRSMKGYQIIGKSANVDAPLSSSFCRWAPSHNSLEIPPGEATGKASAETAWALSCFPLSEVRFAVARSMHGGPEYSGRGGLAVVTRALLITPQQFAQYGNHAVDVARTAMALGHLILPASRSESLPNVTLPGEPFSLAMPDSDFADTTPGRLPSHVVNWVARESCSLLRDQQKVMVVGACDPLPILTLILDQLSPAERAGVSFACGLKPSNRREFRIQFTYQDMSLKLEKDLQRNGIAAIDLSRVSAETR